jgi:hypothetical protein
MGFPKDFCLRQVAELAMSMLWRDDWARPAADP